MKSNVVKCLPVFVLAFGLAACGKDAAKKAGDNVAPAVEAVNVSTAYEADCGADAQAASANSAFNLSSCQLNGQQLAMLQEVGPLKVEADCTHQSVRIVKKDAAEELVGDGAMDAEGHFSIPLTIGARFSQLEGCPVSLSGLATGTVACDADKRVVNIDLNTAFNFAPVADEGTASLVTMLAETPIAASQQNGGAQKGGSQETPKATPAPGKQETPKATPAPGTGGKQEQGKPAATPAPATGGKQEQGKPAPTPAPGKQEQPKPAPTAMPGKGGKQEVPGKGAGQTGGAVQAPTGAEQGATAPGQRVSACVKFEPCAFNSHVSMSCTR